MEDLRNLRTLAEQVKFLLTNAPATRDDDYKLYGMWVENFSRHSTFGLAWDRWAQLVRDKALPSLESMGRARRKVQELYPDLRGEAYRGRIDKEEEYIDFARDKGVVDFRNEISIEEYQKSIKE